jgi:hypothetical protein
MYIHLLCVRTLDIHEPNHIEYNMRCSFWMFWGYHIDSLYTVDILQDMSGHI